MSDANWNDIQIYLFTEWYSNKSVQTKEIEQSIMLSTYWNFYFALSIHIWLIAWFTRMSSFQHCTLSKLTQQQSITCCNCLFTQLLLLYWQSLFASQLNLNELEKAVVLFWTQFLLCNRSLQGQTSFYLMIINKRPYFILNYTQSNLNMRKKI